MADQRASVAITTQPLERQANELDPDNAAAALQETVQDQNKTERVRDRWEVWCDNFLDCCDIFSDCNCDDCCTCDPDCCACDGDCCAGEGDCCAGEGGCGNCDCDCDD